MHRLITLIAFLQFISNLFLVDTFTAAAASNTQGLPSNQIAQYDSLKSAILNPILHTGQEVRAWAWEFENLQLDLLAENAPRAQADSVFYHTLGEVIPAIVYASDPIVTQNLYFVFHDQEKSDQTIEFLEQIFQEAHTFLLKELHLPKFAGLIFVLILDDKTVSTRHNLVSFQHGAGRFLVLNESWMNQEWLAPGLKHRLAHILIECSSQPRKIEPLPAWVNEMAAAVTSDAGKIYSFKEISVFPLSESFVHASFVTRHLEKLKGRETLFRFLRKSLSSDEEIRFEEYYEYSSYDEAYEQAVAAEDRIGRWVTKSLSVMSRFVQAIALPLILLLMFVVLISFAFKNREWIKTLGEIQSLFLNFRAGVKLHEKERLEAAMDKFNEFVHQARKSENAVSPVVNISARIAIASKRLEEIQQQLFDRLSADISRVNADKSDSQAEWAETLCFQLERLQAKFDTKFIKKTQKYLDKNAPSIVRMAWTERKTRLLHTNSYSDIVSAIEACLEYVRQHHESAYFRQADSVEECRKLLMKWTRLIQKPSIPVNACQSFLDAQGLYVACQEEPCMVPFRKRLQRACDHFQVYCQLEQAHKTFESGALFDALQMLSDLFDPLETFYGNTMIRTRILDCFDRHFEPPSNSNDAKLPDPFFEQMLTELQIKHLQKLIQVGNKYSDKELIAKYNQKLEALEKAEIGSSLI